MSSLPHGDRLLRPKDVALLTHETEGSARRKIASGLYGPALPPGTVTRGWSIRESVFWARISALETEPAPRRVPAELRVDPRIEEQLSRPARPRRRPGRGPPKKA